MPSGQIGTLVEYLRRISCTAEQAEVTDRELLQRFVRTRDEAAFATLVKRHGPMVLRVCRTVLGDAHDAEDAFQACFLVLVRKASAVGRPELLGQWLYGVAYRVALDARGARTRRQRHEPRRAEEDTMAAQTSASDVGLPLLEEVQQLPARYRLPVVLCYLEGKTKREAARRLGWPEGTVASRLARARELLRGRLTRRGLAFGGGGFASELATATAPAAVPTGLIQSTVQAGLCLAAGTTAAAAVSSTAIALSQGVLHAMAVAKLKTVAAMLLALVFAGAAAWAVAYQRREQNPSADRTSAPARAATEANESASAEIAPGKILLAGRVTDRQGEPIANAAISVLADPPRDILLPGSNLRLGVTRTDAQGRFRLVVTRPTVREHGSAWVLASSTGHAMAWQELCGPDRSVADQAKLDVSFQLPREQPIRGRLLDLEGRPVSGARVHLSSLGRLVNNQLVNNQYDLYFRENPSTDPDDPSVWPEPALTDRDGRFSLRGVASGLALRLLVRDDRYATEEWNLDLARAPADEMIYTLRPARVLVGRITYADNNQPAAHACLFVGSDSNAKMRRLFTYGVTDAAGRFRLVPHMGDWYSITALPADGQPYLSRSQDFFAWGDPKVLRREVNLSLPRGVFVRGRVIEEGSAKPVVGARVSANRGRQQGPTTDAEGRFRLTVLPGPGWLLVKAPTPDFMHVPITEGELAGNKPSGHKYYPDGLVRLNYKPGTDPPEVTVKLRRGVTIRGTAVKPDGKLSTTFKLVCHNYVPRAISSNRNQEPISAAADGHFELPGCDPDKRYPLFFFDLQNKLGAAVEVPGQPGKDIVVHLARCGAARARLVDQDNKPIANHDTEQIPLLLVASPGLPQIRSGDLYADVQFWGNMDHRYTVHSDAEGRFTFPALIPGTLYWLEVWNGGDGPSLAKEFKVEAGKTLDLGDIVMKRPE